MSFRHYPLTMKRIIFYVLPIISGIILFACGQNYVPKPTGYFRIDLPEHTYRTFDTTFPYTFEIGRITTIEHDKFSPEEPYWINIVYPKFKGRIHLSYKKVDNNLNQYLDDAFKMANKHIPKANSIKQRVINTPEHHVYGLIYDITGSETASAYQFFLTDSLHHFVRGALYFSVTPNNDSLQPVIEFIKKDVEHMIETFKWTNK